MIFLSNCSLSACLSDCLSFMGHVAESNVIRGSYITTYLRPSPDFYTVSGKKVPLNFFAITLPNTNRSSKMQK